MRYQALLKSVKYHSITPVEIWDGADFQTSNIKVNLAKHPHNTDLRPISTMGALPGDPLAGIHTIRDPSGAVYNIIGFKENVYGAKAYGTTYNIRQAPFSYDLYQANQDPESPSGFSYGHTKQLVGSDWGLIEHDRYFNAPAPIARGAMMQVLTGYIPERLNPEPGMWVVLSNGLSYDVVTAEQSGNRSVQCFLEIRDNKA